MTGPGRGLLSAVTPFLALGCSFPAAMPGGPDPEVVRAAEVLKQARKRKDLPGPGEEVPDFRLKLVDGSSRPDFAEPDGEDRVALSSHRGKKPVVLVFGSHT